MIPDHVGGAPRLNRRSLLPDLWRVDARTWRGTRLKPPASLLVQALLTTVHTAVRDSTDSKAP
jgi:hypothetical protein